MEDERYKKLIGKIQSSILEGLEKYLITSRDSYSFKEYIKNVNELLEDQILTLSEGYSMSGFVYEDEEFDNTMQKLFFNYVPLLTVSDDGQRTYKTMKTLNATSLAITYLNDWPEKIPDEVILKETKRLVGAETVLIMHEEKGAEQRENFLHRILGNSSELYITSIPGLVIESFFNDRKNESIFSISYNEFTYQLHSNLLYKSPLFVYPPCFIENFDKVIYNARHPLFERLLNGKKPKDDASAEAIKILISHIESCLSQVYDTVFLSYFGKKHGLEYSENFNYMFIGILKYYPEIFKEFYKAIEVYWKEARNLGVISREEDFIDFSLDDLPWFWNCELTDFRFE